MVLAGGSSMASDLVCCDLPGMSWLSESEEDVDDEEVLEKEELLSESVSLSEEGSGSGSWFASGVLNSEEVGEGKVVVEA